MNSTTTRSSSYIHLLFKLSIFVVFLTILALFPSQPPDIVSKTFLDKFWELVHLLFIGIAVSYGLFSCKTHDEMIYNDSTHDDESFESRVDTAMSFFEDMHENPRGVGEFYNFKNCLEEKRSRIQDAYQYFPGESVVVVTQGNYVPGDDFAHKPLGLPVRSLRFTTNSSSPEVSSGSESKSGMRSSSKTFVNSVNECGERSNNGYNSLGLPVRSLRSSVGGSDSSEVSSGYESSLGSQRASVSSFNGESEKSGQKVVLNLEKYGERRNDNIGYKSLGLPVRSLRGHTDSPRYSSGNSEYDSSLRYSSVSSERCEDVGFDELDLKEKLDEDDMDELCRSSPVPERFGSGKGELIREEMRSGISHRSHFRPLSVDESQFESFKSQSFWSLPSDSSQGSSISYPPSKHSRFSSIASELPDFRLKEANAKQRLPEVESSLGLLKEVNAKQRLPEAESSLGSLKEVNAGQRFAESESYLDSPPPPKPVKDKELGTKKKSRRRFPQPSKSPTELIDDKASLKPENIRSSQEVLSHRSMQKSIDIDFWDLDLCHGKDSLSNKEEDMDSSLQPKPASLDSVSSGSPSRPKPAKDDDLVKQRSFHHLPLVKSSPSKPFNGEVSCCSSSNGRSKLAKDSQEIISDDSKDSSRSGRENSWNKEGQYMDSLSYAKAPSVVKASLSRAKSVRTRRSKRYVAEASNTEAMRECQADENSVGELHPGNNGTYTPELESFVPIAEQASYREDRAKENASRRYAAESEDVLKNEIGSFRARSDEEAKRSSVYSAADDSEVDKKASEFIAKFRQQIRLQKMSSIGDSGELPLGGNYY